jgi:predicted Zn finger-like uncharacterized protein
MLTQCPNCRTRAKLPADHAGNKVRCAECGRVFVARADGEESSRRARLGLLLGGLAGVLLLLALIVFLRGEWGEAGAADAPAAAPPADE